MDQDAFRRTYQEVNARFCAFEKSILTNQCRCALAEKFCIAEREGVRCRDAVAQKQCLELLEVLREQTRFALRSESERALLPHGKAIRIQVGGMRGLEAALDPAGTEAETITDVHGTITRALQRFGGLDALPYSQIMRHIAAYQGRSRSRRRRPRQD